MGNPGLLEAEAFWRLENTELALSKLKILVGFASQPKVITKARRRMDELLGQTNIPNGPPERGYS